MDVWLITGYGKDPMTPERSVFIKSAMSRAFHSHTCPSAYSLCCHLLLVKEVAGKSPTAPSAAPSQSSSVILLEVVLVSGSMVMVSPSRSCMKDMIYCGAHMFSDASSHERPLRSCPSNVP